MSKSDNSADREIVISRIFDAPMRAGVGGDGESRACRQLVGPNGFTTTIESMDFRVGGIWKHMMLGPDGTQYPNKSIFTAIVRLELIAYKHLSAFESDNGAKCDASWTFEAISASQTKLTMQLSFPNVEAHDMAAIRHIVEAGGEQTLERLAGQLKNHLKGK